jgi:[CysO sulfur-carrier protein]-S-L-cysteine hydrolase
VPRGVYDAMVAHALAERPNECCGLLAGRLGPEGAGVPVAQVVAHYPLANAAASPTRYDAEPRGLLSAHRDMWARGLELLAVYHSHPTSEPVPSRTDHEKWFHGPEVVCLIVSLLTDPPLARGWWMTEAGHHEADWEGLG